MAVGPPGFAGGDDYDASNDVEGAGPAYFGFVRDNRGSPVSDAQVVLRPKMGEAVTIKTNVLGLYRSHINKDVVPDDVQITCEKSGTGRPRCSAARRRAPRTCSSKPNAPCSGYSAARDLRPWFETRSGA